MNAMILAAGRGTRLGKLGRTVPKILVNVGGEPLLARQIRYLKESGIKRIVINAHHLADQIESFVAGHPLADDIDIVMEAELLGTAGGVRNALPYLGADTFAVLYGDVIVDEPVDRVAETHRRLGAAVTLTLYRATEVEGKGTVELTPAGTASAFHEKASSDVAGKAYVNAGLYVVEASLVQDLAANVALDFGHDVFPMALARGQLVGTHLLDAPVIDIGTQSMLDLAHEKLG
ncbi:MAG TPA: NDP-sugar synthase [Solirubrobacteraceae bacterium]|jgi:NDP-sugar pyrophosphorylase family protein|nr:NDP-sugar synthase [Solirubrobacteraceae bacterium]